MKGECVLSGLCLFETFFGLFFCGEARVVLKCPIIASLLPVRHARGNGDVKTFRFPLMRMLCITSFLPVEKLQTRRFSFDLVVILQIVYDRNTGRPRGFGFISFSTEDGLNKAMEQNGTV